MRGQWFVHVADHLTGFRICDALSIAVLLLIDDALLLVPSARLPMEVVTPDALNERL